MVAHISRLEKEADTHARLLCDRSEKLLQAEASIAAIRSSMSEEIDTLRIKLAEVEKACQLKCAAFEADIKQQESMIEDLREANSRKEEETEKFQKVLKMINKITTQNQQSLVNSFISSQDL